MTEPVRFSGYVRLPARSFKPRLPLVVGLGMLTPLAIVFLVFNGVTIPSYLDVRTWGVAEHAIALLLFALLMIVIGFSVRKRAAAGVRHRMDAWCDQPGRVDVERAAADLYASIWKGKAARTACVVAFLAAVSTSQCRAVVAGEAPFSPTDDGLLYEEADALEGRARAIPKGLLTLIGLGLVLQLFGVVIGHGINPLYWTNAAWLRMIPAAANAGIMALVYRLVRAPGKAAIVTPGRVQHASMGKTRDFTTDDSVMYVGGGGPQVAVALYRNDGAAAVLIYPSAETAGFKQLINRWCMLAPRDPAGPIPPPVAATVPRCE